MHTLSWIGFCQSLFAAILMFTKKQSSVADKVLSAWMMLLAIDFLSCGINYEIFKQPLLISSFLLFNPALYLYVNALTRPDFRLKLVHLLHLLPFIFFSAFSYVLKEPVALSVFFEKDGNYLFRLFFSVANIISWLVYNPLSLVLVHRHRMHLRNELSNIEKNENLGWVMTVAVFYVVYCILAVIVSVVAIMNKTDIQLSHIYNYSTLLALVYVMSFYGLRQKTVSPRLLLKPEAIIPYKNSTLTEDLKEKIQKKIVSCFEKEKIYLNPDLNMDMLSARLNVPKHQLTEVLDTTIGCNFFQYVNHLRVEAVKEMLTNPKNKFSIEAMGYDCGFSSKSSFYTVFKNITGETPDYYRKKYFLQKEK